MRASDITSAISITPMVVGRPMNLWLAKLATAAIARTSANSGKRLTSAPPARRA